MPPDGRRSSSGNRHRGSSNSSSRQGSSGGGSSSRSRSKSSSRRRDNESNHRRGRRGSAAAGGGGGHHQYGNYGQHHHHHLHENESIVGSLAPSVANTENTESTTQISNTKISKFQASLEAKARAKKKQEFAAMRSASVASSSQSRAKSRVNEELKDVGASGGSSNSSTARSLQSQSRSKSQSSLVQKQPTQVPSSPSATQRRDVHVNYTTGGGGGADDDKADHRDDRPHNLENGVGVGGMSMTQAMALETMGASGGARFQMMDITVTVLGLSGILAEKRAPKGSKVQSLVSKIKDRTMGSPRSVMSSNNDASQSSSQHNHNDSSHHRRSNSRTTTDASVVTPVDDDDDVSEEDLDVARMLSHPTFALASFSRNALDSDTTISTHVPSLALTHPVRTYDIDNGDSVARYTGVWPAKNVNVSMDDIDRSSVAFSRVLQRDRRSDGRRRASGDADDSISSKSGSGSGSGSGSRSPIRDASSSTLSSRLLKAKNHDDRYVPELVNMKVGLISGGEMITLGETTLVVSGVVKSVEFNLPLTVHDPKNKQAGRRRRGGGGAGKDGDRNTDLADGRFAPGAALRRRARYLQDLALFHVSKDKRNGSFAWDPSVRYRIDDNATLRVMLTVVPHNTANVELMTLKSLSMNPSMSMEECVADIDASSPTSDGGTNANSDDGNEEDTLDRLGMDLSAIEIGTDNVAAVWKTAPRDTLFNIVGYEPPSPGEEEEMRRESEEKLRREGSGADRRGPSGDGSRDRRRPSELLKERSQNNNNNNDNNNNDGNAKSDIVTEIVHDVSTPREDPPPSTNDKHEDIDGDRDRRKADRAAPKSREPSVSTLGSKKKKSRIGGWANCFSFGNTDSIDDTEITDEMIREFEEEERRRRNGEETTSNLLSNVMCHAGASGEDDDDTAAESYRGYDCDAGTVETEDLYDNDDDDDDTNDDRRRRGGRGGGASRRDRDDEDDDDDDGSYTTYNDEETAFTYGTDGDGTYRTYDSHFLSVESDNHSGSYIVSSNDSLSRRSRESSKVDIRSVRKARETLRRFANRIGVDPEDLI